MIILLKNQKDVIDKLLFILYGYIECRDNNVLVGIIIVKQRKRIRRLNVISEKRH
jgi:hypothetical protein